AGEIEVAVGIEALDEGVAVVVEISLDVERGPDAGVEHGTAGGGAAEARPEAVATVIGDHRRHAGDGESLLGEHALLGVLPVAPVRIGHDGTATDLAVKGD